MNNFSGFGGSNTNLFGGNVGSMFNKPAGTAIPFGSTPTSSTATSNFGFNTNTSNNLFGTNTSQFKPFGGKH